MKRQKSKPARELELEGQLAQAVKERDRATDAWMEESRRALTAMSAQQENVKLKKQLAIVAHLAAGRTNEAIQEFLDPIAYNFSVNVVMNDEVRDRANEEMLKRVVEKLTGYLAELRLEPKPK